MADRADARTLALMVEAANAPLLLARLLGLSEAQAPTVMAGIERLGRERDDARAALAAAREETAFLRGRNGGLADEVQQARADADGHAQTVRELREQQTAERDRHLREADAWAAEKALLVARLLLLRTAHERNARGERSTAAERARVPSLGRIFGELTDYVAMQAFRLRSGIALDDDDTAAGGAR